MSEVWYRHGYSVSGVGLWRLVSLCEMCCVEEEMVEVEVEVKRREETDDEEAEAGRNGKSKVKRKEYEMVSTRVAHRAWMMEMVLRLLRRRVEESRDHYGELLWHINALLILQRCLRRRKEKVESTADDDQYATLLIQVKSFGLALPVNGKTASCPPTGTSTPAEVSSGSSSYLPYYPFIASASSFPFASLDYNRSAISSSLTPLGFLLHHTTSFLRSLFSLLFHHLSFAVSYRLPLSSILSPSSFALETILDFLTDVQSFRRSVATAASSATVYCSVAVGSDWCSYSECCDVRSEARGWRWWYWRTRAGRVRTTARSTHHTAHGVTASTRQPSFACHCCRHCCCLQFVPSSAAQHVAVGAVVR